MSFPSRVPVVTLLMAQAWFSVPFLDLFVRRDAVAPLIEQSIQIEVASRSMPAYLVTPAAQSRLPAVLLAGGRDGLTDTLRQFAREIAGIGYVALAVDYRGDETSGGSALLQEVTGSASELNTVADWLAKQPSVDAERIGAVGWNDAFEAVRNLGETSKVRAVYPAALAAQAGITEQRWVEIYEYLGTHVEDAPSPQPSARPAAPIARVVDIMRGIMSDHGTRGRLALALAAIPRTDDQWEQARSDAAIMAEAGNLLLAERPQKGSVAGWMRRATDFRTAAETLHRAIQNRDFPGAQQALRELPRSCAACHAEHR